MTRGCDDAKPGTSAAALAAARGKAGAKAGAERRAARIAAEREASRAAAAAAASASHRSSAATGDVLPADFDQPPGHPLLRRYVTDGVAKPAGGTTLSDAMDYVKKVTRCEGEPPPAGTEHLGREHSESRLAPGGYRGS